VIDTLFTPADFAGLSGRDLSRTTCVVFDVLRATSSMLTALANGAEAIIPVATIPEALAVKKARPEVMLAGERDGLRILGNLTEGVDFDLGNSPREFTAERVQGQTIVWTTTNGTRALRACVQAQTVLVGAFLNVQAVTDWLRQQKSSEIVLVCSGTFEETATEDVLAAGALCDRMGQAGHEWGDASFVAWKAFRQSLTDGQGRGPVLPKSAPAVSAREVSEALCWDLARSSKNARRLLARPALAADVSFCVDLDKLPWAACLMADGAIRTCPSPSIQQPSHTRP